MGFPQTGISQTVKWKTAVVNHTSNWSINLANEAKEYIDNGTNGLYAARPGPGRVSGSFTVGTENGAPPCFPGQIGELKLYIDGTYFWTIAKAIIESTPATVDSNGNVIGYTVNWKYSSGLVTAPDGSLFGLALFELTA